MSNVSSGHRLIHTPRRFYIFMRRTSTPHSSLLTPHSSLLTPHSSRAFIHNPEAVPALHASSFRAKREILVIRGEGLTISPHVPRCSAFLICLSYRQCPIRPFGAPSPRGEGCFYTSRHLDPSTQFSYFQISHFLTYDVFLRSG